MKNLRVVILTFLATTALVSAGAGSAFAGEPVTANSCATDGSTGDGQNALDTDKDPMSNDDVIDAGEGQADGQNGNAENKNNDCGETGDAKNETDSATTTGAKTTASGTNQNGKSDEQSGNHDDGNKDK